MRRSWRSSSTRAVELLVGGAEQLRVVDGDGGLPGEGVERRQIVVFEQPGDGAVIDVDQPDHLAAHAQRRRHDAAQRLTDDAVLIGVARVFGGVGRDNRLARVDAPD